jgi:peroxiredoxin
MLNNVSNIKYHNHYTEVDMALKTNVNKLKIADTLIKNPKVKNIIINTIAFQYLLEDQNMVNNQTFFDTYNTISTDKSTKNEIRKIGNAIKLLNVGKTLPNIQLIDKQGNKVNSEDLITGNTVFFFWTEKLYSHYVAAHNKVIDFQKKYPNYTFIAINLDNSNATFNKIIEQYNFNNFKEYRCSNFEEMKSKWAITKVHRTIIVNKDKTIKNGFTNMFEVNFEDNLK